MPALSRHWIPGEKNASDYTRGLAARPRGYYRRGEREDGYLWRDGRLCQPHGPLVARARGDEGHTGRPAAGKSPALPPAVVVDAKDRGDAGANLDPAHRAGDRLYPRRCRMRPAADVCRLCRYREGAGRHRACARDGRCRRYRVPRRGRVTIGGNDRRPLSGAVHALFLGHDGPAQGDRAATTAQRGYYCAQPAGRAGDDGGGHARRWQHGLSLSRAALPRSPARLVQHRAPPWRNSGDHGQVHARRRARRNRAIWRNR